MVQSVENLTRITGTIVTRKPHPTLEDYDLVELAVQQTEGVAGKADLIGQLRGTTLGVSVQRQLLGDAKAGMRLRCRARRTPDGAMCEKQPDPDDFSVD